MAYEAKTKATDVEADGFIARCAKPQDGAAVVALMRKVSGLQPRMWGPTIVGFGEREYELAGGRTGRMCAIGFSPRKAALVFYLRHADGWDERLARLGKHDTGKGCLYIRKLADVDMGVLEELVAAAWDAVEKAPPA
ncbi:MAG: DUF1801 domain-containing protein [Proteobacteria bacterium]|nr:DUF1801 domain-containing protein [Pseudomonadota bacterium]